MKQLFVCNTLLASKSAFNGALNAAQIAFVELGTNAVLVDEPTKNFAVYLGRGTNFVHRCIPEVDVKSLKTTKSAYDAATMAGQHFNATVTPDITNVVEGDIYTLVLSKVGTPFNERGNWTFDYVVPSDSVTVDEIINYFVDAINNNNGLPLTAENNSSTLAITGDDYSDWTIIGADDWQGTIVISTNGAEPVQDSEWLKKLARECAENKGFEYLAEDGKELYPGFPESIADNKTFTVYTLRWAVPRASAKTRDEVVNQLLHIAIDSSQSSVVAALDEILGTGE